MKKLLALLVALLMILSAFGVAEELPVGGKQLTIKDVVVQLGGGQTLDLSGIDLVLAAAANDEQVGLRLAMEGAGANILNAIMAIDDSQMAFHVDGLSDVYAISMEDLARMMEQTGAPGAFQSGFNAGFSEEDMAAIEALMERVSEISANCVTPAGTETIDSVEYQVFDIVISEEQMTEILGGMMDFLDRYPQLLGDSEYDSFREMLDKENPRISINGKMYASETAAIVRFYETVQDADMEEPECMEIYFEATQQEGAADMTAIDIYGTISEMDGDTATQVGAVNGTLTTVNDEFGAIETYFYEPDAEDEGVYVNVYAPSAQDSGMWQVSFGSKDPSETSSFDLVWGNAEGEDQMYLQIIDDESDMVYVAYAGANGIGSIETGVYEGDTLMGGISANVEVADDDGSWLPGSAENAVNLLTIDETQTQKVSSEAMSLLMNVLYGISQANPDLGALISGAMSGEAN